MANQWLRLWHDMPTDPKWRTISKVSGQRIGDVIAVFTHLLVCASNATERGRTQSFNSEDVASALDLETEQVEAIIQAMQSRVLDGDLLKGWEIRQVAREDGSAERAKAWREDKKAKQLAIPNATERKQTPDKDKDTDKEEIPSLSESAIPPGPVDQKSIPEKPESPGTPACPFDALVDAYESALPDLPGVTRSLFRDGVSGAATAKRWAWVLTATHEKGSKKGQRLAVTQQDGIDWFTRFFVYAAGSDFLTGTNGKFPGCSLGWLVTKANFEKVLAGNYHMDKAA
jgi:hypothetical protein